MADSRYTVATTPGADDRLTTWRLRDERTGAEARVVPGWGGMLMGLRLAVRGQAYEVLAPEPPDLTHARHYGAPVLFPYPNRVRQARYHWQGRDYRLPATPTGHAIHGLVRERAFDIVGATGSDERATVTCCLASTSALELAAAYPFPFRFDLTYTLDGRGLRTQATVQNVGQEPMPFGLGFHPYFRVPLAPGGRREDCRVQMWAPCAWAVDGDLLPTGAIEPARTALDVRGYPALGTTAFDTYFTRLALDDPGAGTWSSRLLDPVVDVEVVVVADAAFREAVLFAPAGGAVVSIEPYTCVADALNLTPAGIDAGLLVLEPGASWTAGYAISARSLAYADDAQP